MCMVTKKYSVFDIKHKDKKTAARVGLLRTKKGEITTPFFMPVSTKGNVKFMTTHDLHDMGVEAVISNALILSLRPGTPLLKKVGGIGKFMNFKGINFTDSGGFQMYSKFIYLGSTDEGVTFKNPFSGEKIFMTPESNMNVQLDINSDVAMCLDSMPLYADSKEAISIAVDKTIAWAARCKKEHDKLQTNLKPEDRQLLFGILQGGVHDNLRKKCAKEMSKLNFDGYSIGGIALPANCYGGDMEKVKKLEHNAIKIQKKVISEKKPCYLMGEGDPIWMLEAIALGCDIFDSRMPTQSARHGTMFTSKGKIKLMQKIYEEDLGQIDPECDCFVCKSYSRAFIRHQLIREESTGKILATYHNLYYMQRLIRRAREEIKKGTFGKFLKEMKKIYGKK